MASRRNVVISLLGPTLDAGQGPARWKRWRPNVALAGQADLPVTRVELLYQDRFRNLATLVEDDIRHVSPDTEVRLHELPVTDPWNLEQVYGALHDFARAYAFNTDREDYLIHITTGTHIAQICMFLLTESRYFPARLLQTSPPPRGQRPAGPGTHAIIDLDLSRYDRLASRFRQELTEDLSFLKGGIDTRNAPFNRLIEQIERVAVASRAPMLLMGPTGAGKSQLARRIHELKKQRRQLSGEFVEVNCATLRGDGAMSALFGHVRGAFTGATGDRPGLLRKAHGGMLFLDEIGELGADEQAMLLRAVEEKTFLPMGSDREVHSEFQLIAGTNRDLHARVVDGGFREDLLSRINLWTFRLPGLKERPEDVEPNLEFELREAARLLGVHVTFSREARQRFLDFATSGEATWAGNFRDFNASVTRMATLADGGRISTGVVDSELARLRAQWSRPGTPGDTDALAGVLPRPADVDLFDRAQLVEVIRTCRGSKSLSEAGRRLFAASRARRRSVNDADRLRKYLARFGLTWADVHAGE
ncbi:MAG: sigma 54-interacting transcriptional regulator [Deltaproteobacteria bacterium]|nr:sigma 54-interacting transcriptional regulator [Deltaproteobacteria bacterium]